MCKRVQGRCKGRAQEVNATDKTGMMLPYGGTPVCGPLLSAESSLAVAVQYADVPSLWHRDAEKLSGSTLSVQHELQPHACICD